jgi:tetratricopeptide (TPR) repeat protein
MVAMDPQTGRYHLTETVRAFAAERLEVEQLEIRLNHFHYFQAIACGMLENDQRREMTKNLPLFEAESDNFRAAVDYAAGADPALQLNLMTCLARTWFRVYPGEAIHELSRALDTAPDASDADHIWARIRLAQVHLRTGAPELAEPLLLRALADLETTDIPAAKADALLLLSWHGAWVHDWKESRRRALEAIEIAERNGFKNDMATGYSHLGEAERAQGDLEEAQRSYERALALAADPVRRTIDLYNLGSVSIERGDLEAAERSFRANIDVFRNTPEATLLAASGFTGLGYVFVKQGEFRRAGLLMGHAEERRSQKGIPLDPIDKDLHDRMMAMGNAEFRKAFDEGRALTYEQVLAVAENRELSRKS